MDIPYPVSKTALLQATYENKIEEVTRLIDNGADINEKLRYNYNDDDNEYDDNDDNEYTALMVEVMKQLPEMVKLLLTKGADVNAQDGSGYTALMLLSSNNYDDIGGYTATHKTKKDVEICKLLLRQDKIDINIKNKSGETALDIATKSNHEEIIKLLEQYPINQQDKRNLDFVIENKRVDKPYGKQRLHPYFKKKIGDYLGGGKTKTKQKKTKKNKKTKKQKVRYNKKSRSRKR